MRKAQPVNAASRHVYRLRDMRKVHLSGWPPPVPGIERSFRKHDEFFKTIENDVLDIEIHVPQPVVGWCVGHPTEPKNGFFEFSLFLFPTATPKHQGQAIGQLVVQATTAGVTNAWVDALKDNELSDENLEDIHRLQSSLVSKTPSLSRSVPPPGASKTGVVLTDTDADMQPTSPPKIFIVFIIVLFGLSATIFGWLILRQ